MGTDRRRHDAGPAWAAVIGSGPILVVDDDPEHRSSLCEVLRDAGYVVFDVGSVRDGLQIITSGPRLLPSLILLDLQMPTVSAWEMVDVLRRYTRWSEIPVVIFGDEPMVHLPQDSVVAHLPRPFRLDRLLDLVQEYSGLGPGTGDGPGSNGSGASGGEDGEA